MNVLRMTPILIGCALSGCAVATTPISTAASQPVPESQIINAAYQTPELGDARIVVKRDTGFLGSACDFLVVLQGTTLAALKPGQRIDLYVKPGDYIVGATQGCGQTAIIQVEANVKSGDLKTFRLELDGQLGESVTFRIMPTENY